MKEISVNFSNDQSEVLEHISKMCKKNTSEFIKEALLCLLPVNEYIQIKQNLIVLKNNDSPIEDQQEIKQINENIHDINISANNRLKRIGVI